MIRSWVLGNEAHENRNGVLLFLYMCVKNLWWIYILQKGSDINMRCPKCNNNVYSHHQKINKSGTEIKRNYGCLKCKYVFETVEQIIKTDKK